MISTCDSSEIIYPAPLANRPCHAFWRGTVARRGGISSNIAMTNVIKGKKGFVSISLSVRFWKKFEKKKEDECWPWNGTSNTRGRGQIFWNGKLHYAPKISWLLHHKELPTLCVLHRCDNPNCVNPKHLWLGTQGENMRDCVAKGRFPMSKVHAKEKLEILRLSNSGMMGIEIAPLFDISPSQISMILKKQRNAA